MPQPEVKFLKLKQTTYAHPILVILIMWGVLLLELHYNLNFDSWGITPRTLWGLLGIVFAPFIHSGAASLFANSLPLLVLGVVFFYYNEGIAWKVLIYGLLFSGFLTWLAAPATPIYIGADGLIYFLIGFLLIKGILTKNYRALLWSLVIWGVYTGITGAINPHKYHTYWPMYLSGFVAGTILAFLYKKYQLKPYREPEFRSIDTVAKSEEAAQPKAVKHAPQTPENNRETSDNSGGITVKYHPAKEADDAP